MYEPWTSNKLVDSIIFYLSYSELLDTIAANHQSKHPESNDEDDDDSSIYDEDDDLGELSAPSPEEESSSSEESSEEEVPWMNMDGLGNDTFSCFILIAYN